MTASHCSRLSVLGHKLEHISINARLMSYMRFRGSADKEEIIGVLDVFFLFLHETFEGFVKH